MKIKIDEKELTNYIITKFALISEFNKHTKLNIELEMLDTSSINGSNIELIDESSFFKGKIYDKLISKYAKDGRKALICAFSYSKLMDIEKHFRIFQDETITYYDIVKEVMKNYDFKYMISDKLKIKTDRLYIQYEETDFEFLKRILSNIHEYIYSTYNGLVMIGVQNVTDVTIDNIDIEGIKNDNSYYRVRNKIYMVGDTNTNQNICKINIELDKNIFLEEIELCNKEKFKYYPKQNIKGTFIEASVVEVIENNKVASMKVDFSRSLEDKSKNKKKLSFATPYSKTNTGFFPTPEIGDIVDVYFPSNNENEAKVAFCINNEGSNKFCTDKKRYFNTKDSNIELIEGNLVMNLKKCSYILKDEFNCASSGYIAIESKDELSLYGNKLDIVTKNSDINLKSKGNVNIKANKIFNN